MSELEGWTPAFPGQRPPLTAKQWAQPGHERSLVHGAHSPRRVDERAAEIEHRERGKDSWPIYLNDGSYDHDIRAWTRAEAMVSLLWDWLAAQDIERMLTEVTEMDGTENAEGGRIKRRSTTRRIVSGLDQLHRFEGQAAKQRASLGLSPLARFRMGKDLANAASHVDAVQLLTSLREAHEAQKVQEASDGQQ